jgi:RimJ/RimL family protein N-acetyltransferase
MRLVENVPLDTGTVADLLRDRDDLHLVWPLANYPFDHDQWKKVLDPEEGNVPFLVYQGALLIGHAALRRTEEPEVYALSFLYLIPELRSRGLGKEMVNLLANYASERLSAKKLTLKVRTYNPRALGCYLRCGFQEESREGTLIRMSKPLSER